MAGIPTDHLADLVQQTNERLGNQIRESNQHLADQIGASNDRLAETNQRLTEAIDRLAHRVEDGERGLTEFRVDVAEKFGAVNGAIERLGGRLDHSLSVAKWTIGILTPVILGLIGTAFWLTWQAAKLDSRVERIESVAKGQGKTLGQR
jgi:hypothetical protein